MAKTKKEIDPKTPVEPEATPEPKKVKGEYRVVGRYNNQEIDRVYTEKELAESLAKKIKGKIV